MSRELIDLKTTAQNIIDAVIDASIKEQHSNVGLPLEQSWERIRVSVAGNCQRLIAQGLISRYHLEEINTEDIEGWSISQGVGKIFTLWLIDEPRLAGSEPKIVVYSP